MREQLNQVIKSYGFGSLEFITEVFQKIKSEKYSFLSIESYCKSQGRNYIKSLPGLIRLLIYIKWIDSNYSKEDILIFKSGLKSFSRKILFGDLFKRLSQDNVLHKIIKPSKIKNENDKITININAYYSAIRDLLVDTGLVSAIANQHQICEQFNNFFCDVLIPRIEESDINRYRSEKSRIASNQIKSDRGNEAEKYVLAYELRNRKLHKNKDKIKIISKDDSGCGYDIKSFLDDTSLILNKLIEVKSYSTSLNSKPYFYWSRNEINAAKDNPSTYFLYLIDRKKIYDSNYEPEIISNPFHKVIKTDEWVKEPDGSLKITKKKNN